MNAGNANPDNLKQALANAGSTLAGMGPPFDMFLTPDLPPQVGLLNTVGIAAFELLAGLLGVDCDGTVVKHQVCGSRSSFDNKFAAGARSVTQTIAMPGDPSPIGCGDTSLYKVTLTWIRTDDQPVRGPDPGSTFLILSRASGLVLDIPDATNNPGIQIQQFPENGGGNQKWKLVAVPGNYWNIQSLSSGLVLDVEHSSNDNHARILQWPNNGGRNQQWEFDLVQDPLEIEGVRLLLCLGFVLRLRIEDIAALGQRVQRIPTIAEVVRAGQSHDRLEAFFVGGGARSVDGAHADAH